MATSPRGNPFYKATTLDVEEPHTCMCVPNVTLRLVELKDLRIIILIYHAVKAARLEIIP